MRSGEKRKKHRNLLLLLIGFSLILEPSVVLVAAPWSTSVRTVACCCAYDCMPRRLLATARRCRYLTRAPTSRPSFAILAGGQASPGTQNDNSAKTQSDINKMTATTIEKQPTKHNTGATSAATANAMVHDDESFHHLQHRMQSFVKKYGGRCRLAIAIAGGGGHFLSTLSSTPGASRLLLEGAVTYDRESYRQYVFPQALDANTFRYASAESASYASTAALHRALKLSALAHPGYGHLPVVNMSKAMGMACASALRSEKTDPKGSRAFITVTRSDMSRIEMKVKLAGTASDRSRFEEDVMVSHLMLTCLEYALMDDSALRAAVIEGATTPTESEDDELGDVVVLNQSTPLGDQISIRLPWSPPPVVLAPSSSLSSSSSSTDEDQGETSATPSTPPDGESLTARVIRRAAECILSGRNKVVALMPNDDSSDGGSSQSSSVPGFDALMSTKMYLPPDSLVFPGSFHPPHAGHVELVRAALRATGCRVAWFELSVTNADKPSLEAREVVERLERFLALQRNDVAGGSGSVVMPPHWGILLTNAPLFAQKVDLLHPLQVSRGCCDPPKPPLHFVIGTDTLVRLLNPKYYGNSEGRMMEVLSNMPCCFCVGGRLEQIKQPKTTGGVPPTDGPPPRFVTGQSEVETLPAELKSKFTLLKDFRVDISSTEIRKQMAKEGKNG